MGCARILLPPGVGSGGVYFFRDCDVAKGGWMEGMGGGKRWVLPEVLHLVVDEMCALLG